MSLERRRLRSRGTTALFGASANAYRKQAEQQSERHTLF
jgi:hypothetical protein